MKADLNKPVLVKLKFSRSSDDCGDCVLCSSGYCLTCGGGHWEIDEVFPQSDTTFDLLQLQDSINSVGAKISQVKSEIHQINEEVKEEPKYFY